MGWPRSRSRKISRAPKRSRPSCSPVRAHSHLPRCPRSPSQPPPPPSPWRKWKLRPPPLLRFDSKPPQHHFHKTTYSPTETFAETGEQRCELRTQQQQQTTELLGNSLRVIITKSRRTQCSDDWKNADQRGLRTLLGAGWRLKVLPSGSTSRNGRGRLGRRGNRSASRGHPPRPEPRMWPTLRGALLPAGRERSRMAVIGRTRDERGATRPCQVSR